MCWSSNIVIDQYIFFYYFLACTGDWVNDKKSGFGVLTKSTSVYTGEFFNGRFHGRGLLKPTDEKKAIYDGKRG